MVMLKISSVERVSLGIYRASSRTTSAEAQLFIVFGCGKRREYSVNTFLFEVE